jgi:hypothetical protein
VSLRSLYLHLEGKCGWEIGTSPRGVERNGLSLWQPVSFIIKTQTWLIIAKRATAVEYVRKLYVSAHNSVKGYTDWQVINWGLFERKPSWFYQGSDQIFACMDWKKEIQHSQGPGWKSKEGSPKSREVQTTQYGLWAWWIDTIYIYIYINFDGLYVSSVTIFFLGPTPSKMKEAHVWSFPGPEMASFHFRYHQ